MYFLIYTALFMTLSLSVENETCVKKLYVCFDVSNSVETRLSNLKNMVTNYIKEVNAVSDDLHTEIYTFDSEIKHLKDNGNIYQTIRDIEMFPYNQTKLIRTHLEPCLLKVQEQLEKHPETKTVLLLTTDGRFHDWRKTKPLFENIEKKYSENFKVHVVASGDADFNILNQLTNPRNIIYDQTSDQLQDRLHELYNRLCETFENCPDPIPVNANGITYPETCQTAKRGEFCNYRCPDSKVPSTQMVCNEDGWTPAICVPGCPNTVRTISGLVRFKKLSRCDSYTEGSLCNFFCGSFDPIGQLLCHNGQWNINNARCSDRRLVSMPRCQKISDKVDNVLKESLENCINTYKGQKCTPVCKEGYRSKGHYVCENNHQWSNKNFRCLKICPANTIPFEGHVNSCGEGVYGDACPYSCPVRFKKTLDGKIICVEIGWTSYGQLCERTQCDPPVLSEYPNVSSHSCNEVNIGENCKLHCLYGYQKSLGHLNCGDNGFFTNVNASCLTFCEEKTVEIGGSENSVLCKENKEGENCPFECPNLFEKTPDANIFCSAFGKWTQSSETLCRRIFCGTPKKTNNLQKHLSLPPNHCDRVRVDEECELDCDANQKSSGSLVCQNDGTYLNNNAECVDICHEEEFGITGTVEKVKCPLSEEGQKCTVKCPTNYQNTSNELECKSHSWTKINELPFCKKKVCSKPSDLTSIENIDETSKKCDQIEFGEQCIPDCKEGYSPQGFISCEDDVWNTKQVFCVKVFPVPKIDEDSNIDQHSIEKCRFAQPNGICSYDCVSNEQHKFGNITLKENQWNVDNVFCSRICDLKNLVEIKNSNSTGYKNCSKIHVGQNCTVPCNNGHELLGDPITCLSDHTLRINNTFCMPVRSKMTKIAENASPVTASLSAALSGLTVGAMFNAAPMTDFQAFVSEAIDYVSGIGPNINLDDPEIYIM